MESYTFRAMNSDIVLAAEGNKVDIEAGFKCAQSIIEAYEQRFSRFREDSELSEMNRASGHWFMASPELFELVKLSKYFYERTGGLFDPSILADLKRAGYDRSMDELRSMDFQTGVNRSLDGETDLCERIYFGSAQLDEEMSTVLLPEGLQVDLGGIAKGWIAEKAALQLAKFSSACVVSAGGDMVLIGLPEGIDYWQVELEDPRQPSQTLNLLKVGPGAVATSSVIKRSWRQGESVRHHLIDPRTGEPAVTDWLSVTAIANTAAEAEVFAKVYLIAGAHRALEIFSQNQEISFIAVDQNGMCWGPINSTEYIL